MPVDKRFIELKMGIRISPIHRQKKIRLLLINSIMILSRHKESLERIRFNYKQVFWGM